MKQLEKMEIKPPPRLVALDTEVFDRFNFNYNSKPVLALIELVKEEKIKLFLTSVTYGEVKAHITEGSKQTEIVVKRAMKDLKKNLSTPPQELRRAKVSSNSGLFSVFRTTVKNSIPNFEQINQELLDQFESFVQQAMFSIIEVNQVSPDIVFNNYFSKSPPFSEGKKKYEFPDAFSLLSLEKEAEARQKNIYIVSNDSDWERFCKSSDNLVFTKDLNDLLEIINRETNSDEVDKCYELYRTKEDEIKKRIQDDFLNLDFSTDLSDTISIEWGSETIDDITINSVDIRNSSLVYIDDTDENRPSVTFELLAEVNYNAVVSYESLEYATYDKEDDVYFGGETVNTEFSQSIEIYIEVLLTLSRNKAYSLYEADIEDITIDPNKVLGEIVISTDFDEFY